MKKGKGETTPKTPRVKKERKTYPNTPESDDENMGNMVKDCQGTSKYELNSLNSIYISNNKF